MIVRQDRAARFLTAGATGRTDDRYTPLALGAGHHVAEEGERSTIDHVSEAHARMRPPWEVVSPRE